MCFIHSPAQCNYCSITRSPGKHIVTFSLVAPCIISSITCLARLSVGLTLKMRQIRFRPRFCPDLDAPQTYKWAGKWVGLPLTIPHPVLPAASRSRRLCLEHPIQWPPHFRTSPTLPPSLQTTNLPPLEPWTLMRVLPLHSIADFGISPSINLNSPGAEGGPVCNHMSPNLDS